MDLICPLIVGLPPALPRCVSASAPGPRSGRPGAGGFPTDALYAPHPMHPRGFRSFLQDSSRQFAPIRVLATIGEICGLGNIKKSLDIDTVRPNIK